MYWAKRYLSDTTLSHHTNLSNSSSQEVKEVELNVKKAKFYEQVKVTLITRLTFIKTFENLIAKFLRSWVCDFGNWRKIAPSSGGEHRWRRNGLRRGERRKRKREEKLWGRGRLFTSQRWICIKVTALSQLLEWSCQTPFADISSRHWNSLLRRSHSRLTHGQWIISRWNRNLHFSN